MKVLFSREMYSEMEKAFGKKDLSKLRREIITDKNGHRKTVYKKIERPEEGKNKGKAEPKEEGRQSENGGGNTRAEGDIVVFKTPEGRFVNGTVIAVGRDGCTIIGNGAQKGIKYRVKHDAIRVLARVNERDEIRKFYDANNLKPDWRNGCSGMQPKSCDTIRGLLSNAEAVRQEFSEYSEKVKKLFSSYNPILLKRPNLKRVYRIKEKLREDAKENPRDAKSLYERTAGKEVYHCRTIRDTDGHTFGMKNIEDIEKIFSYFNKKKEIVRVKNNFTNPSAVGYSDINMNILLSNGTIAEIQLNTVANIVAKERYGHALYEVFRSVSTNPDYTDLAIVVGDAQEKLYKLSNKYSKEGSFPDVPEGNVYAASYRHEPYAEAIRDDVRKAVPLFLKAKKEGVLDAETVKNFENLLNYIR